MEKDFINVSNFIFEMGHLKRQKHSGWTLAGVDTPVSVAEHSFRAAQIAYILAVMEKEADPEADINPEKLACILLFHDIAEARTLDQHKVAARYYSKKEAETKALAEQVALLGKELETRLLAYEAEISSRQSREGIIAKDADWLETAFQAKEYIDIGYDSCWDWINNVEKALKTDSARKLLSTMKDLKFSDWWKNLKKMTY